ncbi:putative quinol monooxygenase [Actinocrinis sp.]|uniref:putative quinol monooxygenase n=1 Tax=Actinocrinis sp. TaxID=1920516 RepID=UPI002C3CF2A7|nr:putative quinol monooxygenase [Actinocrinis sp.]HXR72587.1 putative quinol monooxygenase [Actinocrinis sp.]
MLAFALHIRIKPEYEPEALRTLSDIERSSRADAGCLGFTWFRDQNEPDRFLLIEQWESQQHLDAHLSKVLPVWEPFTPALAEEPRSVPLRPVVEN